MTDRDTQIGVFLDAAGMGTASATPLAGDASSRRYLRLTDPKTTDSMVLMDDPTLGTEQFSKIAEHLLEKGLSAPKIMAADHGQGLLVLEDLGDATFTRLIAQNPALEEPLYTASTDFLIAVQSTPAPAGLEILDSVRLADMVSIAFERYAQPITGTDQCDQISNRLADLFQSNLPPETVFLHRDFHADNLIWLPDRSGPARVGVLDFQDAVAGPGLYDLVSLLQDARRDVSPGIEMKMIAHYRDALGLSDHDVRRSYALLGLQRNLRILGVFARLAQDRGKPHYLTLMPRVFDHVLRNLEHPVLAPVADMITAALPNPTSDVLAILKGTE